MRKALAELTEDWLCRVDQLLATDESASQLILGGLLVVRRSAAVRPGRVLPGLIGTANPRDDVEDCLRRLRSELMDKLDQVKAFMDATGSNASQAIVFFSGVDQSEPEWDEVWSTLSSKDEQWAWDSVGMLKKDADARISVPFELIVGRYQRKGHGQAGGVMQGPVYDSFPWRP